MITRRAWRSPRGDWVLELLDGNGPQARAVPRFDDSTGDVFGALWIPAPTRLGDVEPPAQSDPPAIVFHWPYEGDPRPNFSPADVMGDELRDGWIRIGRYRVRPDRIDVAPSCRGSDVAYRRIDRKVIAEIRDWCAAVRDRARKCRERGAPLVWSEIVHA